MVRRRSKLRRMAFLSFAALVCIARISDGAVGDGLKDGEHDLKDNGYEKAIQNFNEAIRLDPKSAFAYHNRAGAHLAQGHYQRAMWDFTRASTVAPSCTFAYHGRCIAHQRAGQIDEAILDFAQTIRLKPSYAPTCSEPPSALYSLGHLRETLRDSVLALAIAPDSPTYLANNSLIPAALGRREAARARVEQVVVNTIEL